MDEFRNISHLIFRKKTKKAFGISKGFWYFKKGEQLVLSGTFTYRPIHTMCNTDIIGRCYIFTKLYINHYIIFDSLTVCITRQSFDPSCLVNLLYLSNRKWAVGDFRMMKSKVMPDNSRSIVGRLFSKTKNFHPNNRAKSISEKNGGWFLTTVLQCCRRGVIDRRHSL